MEDEVKIIEVVRKPQTYPKMYHATEEEMQDPKYRSASPRIKYPNISAWRKP